MKLLVILLHHAAKREEKEEETRRSTPTSVKRLDTLITPMPEKLAM